MAVNATLGSAQLPFHLPASKTSLRSQRSSFWRWSCTDCVHICLGGFKSKSHSGFISLSLSLPSVLSYKSVSTVFSLFLRADPRREMFLIPLRSEWIQSSCFCSLPQNTFFGSHVYLHSSNSTFCNVLFHSCINHSALPFLGHRLQIDYLSGVQCNDRRPS